VTIAQEEHQRSLERLGMPSAVLIRPRIAVQLSDGHHPRPEALAAFMLSANILSRMFHDVTLIAPAVTMPRNPWAIRSSTDLLLPLQGVAAGMVAWNGPGPFDVVLGVGGPPSAPSNRSTWISFSGWLAGLEVELAVGADGVLGGLFGACYGCSQTLLLASQDFGGDRPPITPFHLSLLDYAPSSTNYGSLATDLDGLHLVGGGAVGSACVYTLGHLDDLSGEGRAIDNDSVDGTNLARYVLMRRQDVGRFKVDVTHDALLGGGGRLQPYPMSFKAYRERFGTTVDLMLTPVDSEAGRRALAKELPKRVINAATGDGNVTVSCHGFADGKACLHCLYLPQAEEMTTERRIAIDLGLSQDEVRTLLLENRSIGIEITRRVERHLGKPEGTFDEWAGKHIQSFYQRAVCGEARLPVAGGTLLSPLPFISAAGGVLMAAELVKQGGHELGQWCLDNYFRIDLFSPPNPVFRQTRHPVRGGACICQNKDYVTVYREKYPSVHSH
jgi:hypothetical protein